MVKSDAICKKNPHKVRFMSKMRGANDELVLKITDDVNNSMNTASKKHKKKDLY